MMNIKSQLYTFKAKCVRVIDGDTIEIDLDLGFRMKKEKEKVRLLNVDTPERRQNNYEEAKKFTTECVEGKDIYVQTYKSDNFSRFLANVYYETGNEVRCLNDDLKNRGLIKKGSQWNKFGEERDGIF